jgi:carbamoyltransferase
MKIIGIRYGGHDSSAALMIDGKIVFASSQERFDLKKHSREFPLEAINASLKHAGLSIDEIDEIAFSSDPIYHIQEFYLKTALNDPARIPFLINDIQRIKTGYEMENTIREFTGFKGKIGFYNHHQCHIASAWYPSGFQEAIVISLDGMGEMETGLYAVGRDGNISTIHSNSLYPNSLGLIYSAITFYLGWKHHCDEGIIMGLASYGNPHATIPGSSITYYEAFKEIIVETGDYDYIIHPDWIVYDKVRDKWLSDKFYNLFGPKKEYSEPITEHHQNIAAALQLRLETVVLNHLQRLKASTGLTKLCIAGGVGLNCSMNGKIEQSQIFEEIFIQPASGDDGASIGACYLAEIASGTKILPQKQHNSYLGSSFTQEEILSEILLAKVPYHKPENLYEATANLLADGKIIAWFQGGAEFGPRALGNRSILTRPFPANMKDYLNQKVKFRENFRPFAPAVLKERSSEYFQLKQESPHMLIASLANEDKAHEIPAVVHVDNTCRVQTVGEENNLRFRKLLEAFDAKTGVPVLLNTSFNIKGQPIINDPKQAIQSLLSTNIEYLILGDYIVEKPSK